MVVGDWHRKRMGGMDGNSEWVDGIVDGWMNGMVNG